MSPATFYILLALAGDPQNGVAMAREAERLSLGSVLLPPGTLYRLVKQLLADRWILEVRVDDDDERCRYYALSTRGRSLAEAEARRLETVVRTARKRRLLPAHESA